MKPFSFVAFALLFTLSPVARGADVDQAVSRGLAFLATQQQEDGSIGAADLRGSVGITALTGLAFMTDEAYAGRVQQIAKFLVSNQDAQGYFAGGQRKGSMYDHGFATLFLAQYLKANTQPETRKSLALAVELLEKSQGATGGWRYVPIAGDADTSVTSCELMALAAAREAGLPVAASALANAAAYLQSCQNADGGFGYTAAGTSAFPRSAAALAATLATTAWSEPARRADTAKGAAYLLTCLPQAGAEPPKGSFVFHGHYYAGQALQMVGGETWTRWQKAVRENLLAYQKPDGSWADNLSSALATSQACLTLHQQQAAAQK